MPAIDEFNTPAPKRALMLPEVGQYAHAHFDFAGLLSIEETIGATFSSQGLFAKIDAIDPMTIHLLASHALKKCTLEEALDAMTLEDLARKLADALALCYHGRTYAENEEAALVEFERIRKLRDAMGAVNAEA